MTQWITLFTIDIKEGLFTTNLFDIITGDPRDHTVDRPHQLATEANILNKHHIKVSYMIGVKLAEHLQEVLKN